MSSNMQVRCPACNGVGALPLGIMSEQGLAIVGTVRCVWCEGEGGVSPNVIVRYNEAKEQREIEDEDHKHEAIRYVEETSRLFHSIIFYTELERAQASNEQPGIPEWWNPRWN